MFSQKSRTFRKSLSAAFVAASFGGMLAAAPAHARGIPPLPPIGPTVSGCAALTGLSPCLGTAISLPPIVVIPGFGDGGRNVDVDKDVDRTRTRGRVVVIQ